MLVPPHVRAIGPSVRPRTRQKRRCKFGLIRIENSTDSQGIPKGIPLRVDVPYRLPCRVVVVKDLHRRFVLRRRTKKEEEEVNSQSLQERQLMVLSFAGLFSWFPSHLRSHLRCQSRWQKHPKAIPQLQAATPSKTPKGPQQKHLSNLITFPCLHFFFLLNKHQTPALPITRPPRQRHVSPALGAGENQGSCKSQGPQGPASVDEVFDLAPCANFFFVICYIICFKVFLV